MKKILLLLIVFTLLGCSIVGPGSQRQLLATPTAPLLAFPGAEGYGRFTRGGRGGVIYQVTSCADSGAGTFREAVNKTGPRIVVFRVNCLITLQSPLVIKNPYLTIACQTGNVAFKRDGFDIQAPEVIVRGCRLRVGDEGGPTQSRDGLKVNSWNGNEIYNVIIDHSSIAWGIDENTSMSTPLGGKPIHDVTMSYNVIGEGLHCSIHEEGCHSMNMLLFNSVSRVTISHNLFASSWARNPFLSGATSLDFANNVIYGWWDYSLMIRGTNSGNLVNNYFKSSSQSVAYEIMNEGDAGSKLCKSGNVANYNGAIENPVRVKGTIAWLPTPCIVGISAMPASLAYEDVLNNAGALRDLVDARIVENVRNRTGAVINSQSQVGGWPSYTGALPIDSDRDGLPDSFEGDVDLDPRAYAPSGYMWIEEYINSLFDAPTVPVSTVTPVSTETVVPSTRTAAPATATVVPTSTQTPIVVNCDKPCTIIIK